MTQNDGKGGRRQIAMAHLTLLHLDPPDLVSAAAAGGATPTASSVMAAIRTENKRDIQPSLCCLA